MRSRIYKEYIVYEDGTVYSLNSEKQLKPALSPHGYLMYGNKLGSVHRLVAKCFIGDIPSGMCVNHIDGNKQNNHVSNLEIVTYNENMRYAYRTGLAKGKKGETNSQARLTEEQCISLCEDLLNGLSNEDIGLKYNLHPRYVSLIRGKKRWKYLVNKYPDFPKSNKPLPNRDNYYKFLELKNSKTNKEISRILNVDPSTVSNWRSGKFGKTY